MRWIDGIQGPRKFNNCSELFNCATNTELGYPVAKKNAICAYHLADKRVALVMNTNPAVEFAPEKFAVVLFLDKNIFAYNIGYCDRIPNKSEVEERIQYLQKMADEEWNDYQESITEDEDVSDRNCREILATAAEGHPLFLQVHVRDWYILHHPDDELIKDINPEATFKDIVHTLTEDTGKDVYEVIGKSDSVIRERVFEAVAAGIEVQYSDVYDAWLGEQENESVSPGY